MKKDETKTKPETKDCVQEETTEGVRQSTVFFESWHSSIDMLPTEKEKLKAYRYILNYSFYKKLPEEQKSLAYIIFNIAKPSIDSAQKRYDTAVENGKKGGRPKEIDESKIFELKDRGMTNKAIAEKLGISTKSVSRALDKRQNHNVTDTDTDTDNVNDDVNVNSDASLNNGAYAPTTTAEQEEKELTYEEKMFIYSEKEKVWDLFDKHIKLKEISKQTGFDMKFVNSAVDEYRANNDKKPDPPKKPKNMLFIPTIDGDTYEMDLDEFNPDFGNNEEAKDLYNIFIDPDGNYKFEPEFTAKWFKDSYNVDIKTE